MGPDKSIIALYNRAYERMTAIVRSRLVAVGYGHKLRRPIGDDATLAAWRPALKYNTGFIVEHDGRWLVLTAGHVLEELQRCAQGDREVTGIALGCGIHTGQFHPVPIDFAQTEIKCRVDRDSCLDVGVLTLHDSVRAEMKAAGAEAFTPMEWSAPIESPQVFVVAGFQSGRQESHAGGQRIRSTKICLFLPVEPLRDDYRARGREHQRFRGRVLQRIGLVDGKPVPLADTSGFSGGPIIALRLEEGRFGLSVRAIQTHEIEEDGVIIGNFVEHAVSAKAGNTPALTTPSP